jgi:hypothetical protein
VELTTTWFVLPAAIPTTTIPAIKETPMMTKTEALEMLAKAPCDDKTSRVHSGLTRGKAVEIVRDWILSLPDGEIKKVMAVQRVWQVYRDRRRPKEYFGAKKGGAR